MKISAGRALTPPHEVLRWINERSNAPKAYSISICSHHALSSEDLGEDLSNYLNEFDPEGSGAWRHFRPESITRISTDPHLRRAIQQAALDLTAPVTSRDEFSRTSASLGALGHAILQGEESLLANKDNPNVFKVCLDCEDHGPEEKHLCDLWLNAPRFDPRSQVTSIGDAFLDWCSRI